METTSNNRETQKTPTNSLKKALPAILAMLMSSTALACNSATNEDYQSMRAAQDSLEQAEKDLTDSERRLKETKLSAKRSQRELELTYMNMSPQQATDMLINAKENHKRALESGIEMDIDITRDEIKHAQTACEFAKAGYFTRHGEYPRLSCR